MPMSGINELIERTYSRRRFLSTAVAAPVIVASVPLLATASGDTVRVVSPNGKLEFQLLTDQTELHFRVLFNQKDVIGPSRIGILVNGTDLGERAQVGRVERYRVREKYATRGAHSLAINNCNGTKISVTHIASKTNHTLEVRAFDDGIAFRLLVPGEGERVPDEATV